MRHDHSPESAGDPRMDALLDATAPPVLTGGGELGDELDGALADLSDRARARAGRSARRTRAAVATALVTAAFVVTGTSAAASSGLLDWIGWSPDRTVAQEGADGSACEQAWRIVGDDRSPVVADARALLAGIDLASLDLEPLVAEVERDHEDAAWVLAPGERPWEFTRAGLETEAISRYVTDAVWSGLEELGYGEEDWTGLSIEGAGACTDEMTVVP